MCMLSIPLFTNGIYILVSCDFYSNESHVVALATNIALVLKHLCNLAMPVINVNFIKPRNLGLG